MVACRYGQRPHGQYLVCEEKCWYPNKQIKYPQNYKTTYDI